MATHSRFLPGKSHGQRSLVGCSPQGGRESDGTEHTHTCKLALTFFLPRRKTVKN